MKRKDNIINLFLGVTVITLLVMLFYLTRKSYILLIDSNDAVIHTNTLIAAHQNVSSDFKNAVIYISTYKNSPSQAYVHTYGKGLWEISFDMIQLKRLVNPAEKVKLDTLLKQINSEEDWLTSADTANVQLTDDREQHINNIIAIQGFFDAQISRLEHQLIRDIKTAQSSVEQLHQWIIALIGFTSAIILLSLFLINHQLGKVNLQNLRLREIAWIQSHKMRSQVAILLGLGQLFNRDDPADSENGVVIDNLVVTTKKLDELVHEINDKTDAV